MKNNGFTSLGNKLLDMSNIEGGLREAMRKNTEIVREKAREYVPVNTGDLKQSIQSTITKDGDELTGIVYTASPYAAYVEFGTGPRGAESDKSDVSPNVTPIYKNKGWIIPASAMSVSEAEKYHFFVIRNKNKEVIGYATRGQPAHPFLYPALRDSEKEIMGNIKKEIKEEIEKKAGD